MDKKQNFPGDLLSPGLYNVLEYYTQKYDKLLPIRYSSADRKLVLKKSSTPSHIFLYFSTFWELGHTILSLLVFLRKFSQIQNNPNNDALEVVKTFILFYLTILPPTTRAMAFTLTFTPQTVCNVVNNIESFRIAVSGMVYKKSLKCLKDQTHLARAN